MAVAAKDSKLRARSLDQESLGLAFGLFCVFLLSYFLRLTVRIPALGSMRFDLLLAVGTLAAVMFAPKAKDAAAADKNAPKNPLLILAVYIVISIPFVEWPGSVLNRGLELFFKAAVFYFFAVSTVTNVRKLKIVLAVYTGAQVFRILEPLYMHVMTGYWGSFTALEGWQYMDRLAGSPYDIINPNGLGFLVVTTLPLLHFLCPPTTALGKILWAVLAVALVYTLILTASRSSFLALVILILIFIYRSKHRMPLLAVAGVVAMLSFGMMNDLQRDRYLSIFSSHTKSSGSAEGRINGVVGDLEVAMRRPLFGHGLGTSREANANFRGEDMPSHDLYTEVAQELGFIGLALFVWVLAKFIRDCRDARAATSNSAGIAELEFLDMTSRSVLVLIMVYLFFSFASYGLSEPYWYFVGGIAAVMPRLARKLSRELGIESRGVALPTQQLRPKWGKHHKSER